MTRASDPRALLRPPWFVLDSYCVERLGEPSPGPVAAGNSPSEGV